MNKILVLLKTFFKKKKLKIVLRKERGTCPFYGFAHASGTTKFFDQGGSQCALILKRYVSCRMEGKSDVPDWKKCHLNRARNQKTVEDIMQFSTIFPQEFMPEKNHSWPGMKFKTWVRYVMNNKI
ncbi:MAG: hypothetical protein AAB596_01790 [Patescibacteria group bacterium]